MEEEINYKGKEGNQCDWTWQERIYKRQKFRWG
jgi:hypothetical protein